MASTFLTPVTLWKDFDDTLPLEEQTVGEQTKDGVVFREVTFLGRPVGTERVKIYAQYAFPEGEAKFPAVLVLYEAGFPFDEAFVTRFVRRGFGVLSVDYCGDNGTPRGTVYPEAIDYANFVRAGRHIDYAEPTARETSWYEWAGVARYAARFLSSREEVTRFGAMGLRTGGEVLFKIAPYVPLACMITVCAAGWRAYRGMDKFAGEQRVFDEERHRFIAGIDSQSYAPYVKCPVLLLSAVNDPEHDYDRVYDTFQQLNPAVEKAFLYSAHGNGLIGSHSLADVDLFLDKYLKQRSVFVSAPVNISVGRNEDGELAVKAVFDADGEIEASGIFYTEKATGGRARDWTRVLGTAANLSGNVGTYPLSVYDGCRRALVYAFASYSNNFSVTSKIQEVIIDKPCKNACLKSRVVYDSSRDGLNGVVGFRRRARSIAGCFADDAGTAARLEAGYGGILGATAEAGLVSYRVSEPRYAAPESAALRFDAYAKEDALLKITFYLDADEERGYSAEVPVAGGGKWKGFFFEPSDFKNAMGQHLENFASVVSVVFVGSKEVLLNNIVWI